MLKTVSSPGLGRVKVRIKIKIKVKVKVRRGMFQVEGTRSPPT